MSLFNPYVLLGIVLAIIGSFSSGYYKGGKAEKVAQELEIARLNAEARQKELALTTAVQTQATSLRRANNDAKAKIEKLRADLHTGAIRLRLPVKAAECPVQTAGDTPAPARDSVQTTAELDGKTAQALVSITDDGDKAIRQLNACIDAYSAVYQTLKGTK
jgi:prophage endopeptidase